MMIYTHYLRDYTDVTRTSVIVHTVVRAGRKALHGEDAHVPSELEFEWVSTPEPEIDP